MVDTSKFEFKQLNEKASRQPNKGEFRKCSFQNLKSINHERGIYLFHGDEMTKRVEANTAYEAVRKANLKDIKMICVDNILGIRNIFAPEELLKYKK